MSFFTSPNLERVLEQIPSGLFVLTAAHEGSRFGMLANWVQPCSKEPPMALAAVERGNAIAPLIRDSRRFALCQISPADKQTIRRFSVHHDPHEDPFVGLDVATTTGGAPLLRAGLTYIDCELARHVDIGGDHEIYVGLITDAEILNCHTPDRAA